MKKTITLILVLVLILCSTALADSVKAVADPTYVRTGPGLDYKIVDSLAANTTHEWGGEVVYDNRGIAWYSIYYGPYGTYGWVSSLHANIVSNSGYGNEDARNGAYSNGTSVYATGDVTVRTGPGTNYGSLGTLYYGQSADFTGFKQDDSNGMTWYQINFYGDSGWVPARYAEVR